MITLPYAHGQRVGAVAFVVPAGEGDDEVRSAELQRSAVIGDYFVMRGIV
jgi:hypothetical protein